MRWSKMFIDQGELTIDAPGAGSSQTEAILARCGDGKGPMRPGLISLDPPEFERSKLPSTVSVSINNVSQISQRHAALTLSEYKVSRSNNIVLLDRTLTQVSGRYIFEAVSMNSDQIVGFILSIEHSLRLRLSECREPNRDQPEVSTGDVHRITEADQIQIISTGLTTTVHPKFRKAGLAMDLIRAVIQRGYQYGIYCGYHFTTESHTKSAINVATWYRILDVKKAYKFGYSIETKSKRHHPDFDNLIKKYKVDPIETGWSLRPTIYSDLKFLDESDRKLTIGQITSEQWDRLSATPLRWFSLDASIQLDVASVAQQIFESNINPIVKRLAVIRPFIVYLADTQKVCTGAQLVFFEATDLNAAKQLSNLFLGALIEGGYIVLHGVSLGWVCNLERHLKLIRTGSMWLDFYNFRLPSSRPEEISVIYI